MAASKIENAPWVRLGDLITQRREKNNYSDLPIRGVTREGFIPPKQEDADISLYNVFYKNDFVFNPARMELNSIALNTDLEKGICSSLYEIFYVTDTKKLDPRYLNLFIKRNEFARYCRYDSIGSARNYFRVANMQEIKIPLPSIETQRELVAVYNGLKELAEENEKLLEPLSKSCEAFIVDCKKKYPAKRLGDMIEQVDERNEMLKQVQHDTTRLHEETVCHPELVSGSLGIESVRGISTEKAFINTKADMSGVSLTSYKIVKPNEFVYVADTSRRGEKIALALNGSNDSYLVSSIYTTFKSKNENILRPAYLYLLLSRSEFDRYSRFNSWGSARETFDWSEMCRVQIPLPPIQIQQKIVDLYNCYEECKRIANEAREKISNLCPALVQKAAHSR